MTQYSFTRVSGNSKTGPIPVTMTERNSCPDNCGLKANGCYAEMGHIRIYWNNVNKPFKQGKNGFSGGSIEDLARNIARLPKGQLWRMNQAGDLAHDNQVIDFTELSQIVRANRGKRGFTYTHHDTSIHANREFIRLANEGGFTVNLSADTLAQADELSALNIGPVVTLLAIDAQKVSYTPAGNTVIQCPATYRENFTCAECAICAVASRKAIIGFPVHGVAKRKAENVFKGISITTAKGNA